MDQESSIPAPEKASFGSLPDNILLKIFGFLELKDCVRLGGVNKKFQEISELSIAKIESLELNDRLVAYTNLSGYSFLQLLESWMTTVREIKATSMFSKCLLKEVAEKIFPKLHSVTLEVRYDSASIRKFYADLVRRNPTIRSITIKIGLELEFSQDVIYENLERLEICDGKCSGNDENDLKNMSTILKSLTGRVPSLKIFMVNQLPFDLSDRMAVEFLNSAKRLEILDLEDLEFKTFKNMVQLPRLWYLPNLKSLRIVSWENIDDDADDTMIIVEFLRKLSIACPSLEELTFDLDFEETKGKIDKITMAGFEKLKKLVLPWATIGQRSIFDIIDSCPTLRYLRLWYIDRLWDQNDQLVDKSFMELFASIGEMVGQRKVTIKYSCMEESTDPVMKAWEDAKGDTGLKVVWSDPNDEDDDD